jgi:hypothetical protein
VDKGRNIPLLRSWAAVNINNAMRQENYLTPPVRMQSPSVRISDIWSSITLGGSQ